MQVCLPFCVTGSAINTPLNRSTTTPTIPHVNNRLLTKQKIPFLKVDNTYKISPVEKTYLDKWMRREGMNKIYKYRNVPEIILNNYKAHLIECNKTFVRPGTEAQRLQEIINYIDFIINVFPKYKKFLKAHNLKSYEIGLMLGYKRPITWHNSYRKYDYMRFIVNIITRHKELLETI